MLTFCKGGKRGRNTDYDYDSGPYSFIFPAGITIASFNVTINYDKILESIETFGLSISSPLPDKVFQGNPNQSTVIIVDNDSKWYHH